MPLGRPRRPCGEPAPGAGKGRRLSAPLPKYGNVFVSASRGPGAAGGSYERPMERMGGDTHLRDAGEERGRSPGGGGAGVGRVQKRKRPGSPGHREGKRIRASARYDTVFTRRSTSVMSLLKCRSNRRMLLPNPWEECHAADPVQSDVGGAGEGHAPADSNPRPPQQPEGAHRPDPAPVRRGAVSGPQT